MRKLYNDLCDQIRDTDEDTRKKNLLVSDLTGFNTQIGLVAPALTTFRSSLSQVEGVWATMSSNLAFIANNYTPHQLGDLPWLTQAMKIGDATQKWQAIGTSAQQFQVNSLVDYVAGPPFGTKVSEQALSSK